MDHKTISLTELVSNAKMQLDLLGYAEGTKKQYALKWDHFLMYAELNGHTHFSKSGELLEHNCKIPSQPEHIHLGQRPSIEGDSHRHKTEKVH